MTQFSDKPLGVKRGDAISADTLNEIRKRVFARMVGGKGVNVKYEGDKIVVERADRQIIPNLSDTANIWKLSKSLHLVWAYDGNEEIEDPLGVACMDLEVDENFVTASFHSNPVFTDNIDGKIIRISADNKALEYYIQYPAAATPSATDAFPQRIVLLPDNEFAGIYQIRRAQLFEDDGTDTWYQVYTSTDFGAANGIAYDGTYLYTIGGDNSPAGGFIVLISTVNGSIVSSTSIATIGEFDRLLYDGGYLYAAGTIGLPTVTSGACSKLNTAGTAIWNYDCGLSTQTTYLNRKESLSGANDVTLDGTNSYWVGFRNNTWSGATGYASLWALDSSGALRWAWDSGSHLLGCCNDGEYLYVCGVRSNTATGSTRYATVWKLDFDGALVAQFDTGIQAGSGIASLSRANVIRCNSTHLFVGSQPARRG